MDRLNEFFTAKIQELEELIKLAETFLVQAPEGKLQIVRNKKTYQYYHRTNPKESHGKYIKKSESKRIQELAQKDYAEKILAAANAEREAVRQFLKNYHPEKIQDIYNKLSLPRKGLVIPYVLSDEDFIAQWQREEYPVKYRPEDDMGIYTENNEAVRSKSEKIIADKFKIMGVPYHYEKPLYLQGYGEVYPDFTVLNRRTRKEYYWEHMGLMDNKDYCEKSIKKIETMAKNKIIQGENLILTYETSTHPLNTKIVDLLIEEYLV